MKKYLIVVAGGSGTRMKSNVPKQFMLLKKKPVLMHTLSVFHEFDADLKIILVIPFEHQSEWSALCNQYNFEIPHMVTRGGESRFHSVKNGLDTIQEDGLVAIHDGVRPLVSFENISNVFKTAELRGNAVPCIRLNDSIRKVDGENSEALNREHYRLIQTPQCFHVSKIKKAYTQDYSSLFTDCASVLENIGEKIFLVEGNFENIKITTPGDLLVAEGLMNKQV